MKSTLQEELIAELLGEVGKLKDDIRALPAELDTVLGPMKVTIEEKTRAEQGNLEAAGDAQIAKARREIMGMLDDFKRALDAEAKYTLTEGRTVGVAWQWLIVVAFVFGFFGSLVGHYGAHRLYAGQLVGQAEFAQSVMSVWDRLDGKAKKLIESAY